MNLEAVRFCRAFNPRKCFPLKLFLGTAQLSQNYGVLKNRESKAGVSAGALLSEARNLGFYAIDTAPVYGIAELQIGEARSPLPVYTKLDSSLSVDDSILRSMSNLQRNYLDGVYLHDEYVASRNQKEILKRVSDRKSRDVGAVGVSIYSLEEFVRANENPDIDLIQLPFNILDSRFHAKFLEANRSPEKTIFARSIFLQGVLLRRAKDLPQEVAHLRGYKRALEKFTSGSGLDALDIALGYALLNHALDGIVVGVSSIRELREINKRITTLTEESLLPLLSFSERPAWKDVDPRTWKNR